MSSTMIIYTLKGDNTFYEMPKDDFYSTEFNEKDNVEYVDAYKPEFKQHLNFVNKNYFNKNVSTENNDITAKQQKYIKHLENKSGTKFNGSTKQDAFFYIKKYKSINKQEANYARGVYWQNQR